MTPPDLTCHWCPTCQCNTVSLQGRCPECGSAVQPKPKPAELSLIGFTLTAVLRAGEGVILRLKRPPHTVDILRNGMSSEAIADLRQAQESYDAPFHVAFFPAANLNLPPGVQPNPKNLQQAARHTTPQLMVRTHHGELPNLIQTVMTDLLPPECAPIFNQTITAQEPTPDGSNGIMLQIGTEYLLQINLAGAQVYKLGDKIDAYFLES